MPKNKVLNSYSTPFSAAYWRDAFSEFKDMRMIVLAALIIALRIVLNAVSIPISDSLSIKFTYIVNAFGSMIYGPAVGFVAGGLEDIVSFLLSPQGAFFPGFTITSALGSFFYGIFLYRSQVTIFRLFLAKLSVNALLNVCLDSFWKSILYGKGYIYYFAKGIVKNSIMLPIEVVILTIFFGVAIPAIKRYRMIPVQNNKIIPVFSGKKKLSEKAE